MNVFITGIGGTVGTAFTEFLSPMYTVSGIDHNEHNVANLKEHYPHLNIKVGDFQMADLSGIDVVIHLAAMKHIDLAEVNPNHCVFNNLIRTYELYAEAKFQNADVMFMSTDKAVEPSSVYGYTKALGEAMTLENGWCVVRSGNITGSNGSVFNIWDEAIAEKKPVKLTHKDMRRFFIDPHNLVERVWKMYLTGERFIIPEMDVDAKLIDILVEKLNNKGYTLDNYPGGIEYIGLRPGEKLVEKLR